MEYLIEKKKRDKHISQRKDSKERHMETQCDKIYDQKSRFEWAYQEIEV